MLVSQSPSIGIGASLAVAGVYPASPKQPIVARPTAEDVLAIPTGQAVIAMAPEDPVVAIISRIGDHHP
jgi:hypothetical protein